MTAKEILESLYIGASRHQAEHGLKVGRADLIQSRYEYLKQELTELERLRVFKQTFDNYELAKKQDFIAYENWQECEKVHAELVKDVKRYFELRAKFSCAPETLVNGEIQEYDMLSDRLWKVGREE